MPKDLRFTGDLSSLEECGYSLLSDEQNNDYRKGDVFIYAGKIPFITLIGVNPFIHKVFIDFILENQDKDRSFGLNDVEDESSSKYMISYIFKGYDTTHEIVETASIDAIERFMSKQEFCEFNFETVCSIIELSKLGGLDFVERWEN